MAEVLVRYTARLAGDGVSYTPQACGRLAEDGLWEGWIEFVPESGLGKAVRTSRETEQPNRDALVYWSQGLTLAYLEGALGRALGPRVAPAIPPREESVFEGPAEDPASVPGTQSRPVLDPFATFAEGEQLLRDQLRALSHDHLVAIARGYQLDIPLAEDLREERLADGIVQEVRRVVRR